MKTNFQHSKILIACLALAAVAVPTMAMWHSPERLKKAAVEKGMAVALPWVFKNGKETSRLTAVTTAEEIMRKAGFASIPGDKANAAWTSNDLQAPSFGHLPSASTLKAYGTALHADKVIYGSVAWHTRSIWVNAGPKTISTATVDAYVFDVASGKNVYKQIGITGRSDEKSNGYKLAADIIFTPLVTAVSGGPATPQEQRAVQIAMGLAYYSWVKPGTTPKK
jgi:hypothetical protein